ncbi:hypothetical protein [Spiroplasma clarkii]|uniref:hypothetical protein n=1 Tax=Spiroplasma clarkii TaxID=2139 RepID=UPI001474F1FB|nr:hypothetical protein [Spiroplasma clarkii]
MTYYTLKFLQSLLILLIAVVSSFLLIKSLLKKIKANNNIISKRVVFFETITDNKFILNILIIFLMFFYASIIPKDIINLQNSLIGSEIIISFRNILIYRLRYRMFKILNYTTTNSASNWFRSVIILIVFLGAFFMVYQLFCLTYQSWILYKIDIFISDKKSNFAKADEELKLILQSENQFKSNNNPETEEQFLFARNIILIRSFLKATQPPILF